mmetsp:Transcript_10483/g.19280  ORF Transcript_10483/g.19280 Transcript_10483/m.19280 type:complete len:305 (-) Transcript_10483:4253-5167(-)
MNLNVLRSFVWKITWQGIKERKDRRRRPQRALVDLGLLHNQLPLLVNPRPLLLERLLHLQQEVCLEALLHLRQLAFLEHPPLLPPLVNLQLLLPLGHQRPRLQLEVYLVRLLQRQLEDFLERPLLLQLLASLLLLQLLDRLRRQQVACLVHRLPRQLEVYLGRLLQPLPLASLHQPQRLGRRLQLVVCLVRLRLHLPLVGFLEQHQLLPLGDSLVSLLQPHLCLASLLQPRLEDYSAPPRPRSLADSLAPPPLLLEGFLVQLQHLLQEGFSVPSLPRQLRSCLLLQQMHSLHNNSPQWKISRRS